ncbi:MAG: hypothetical protein E6789_08600, partial [Clostridium baratii]|nr:hypothetical protein [Clostridium baratii]
INIVDKEQFEKLGKIKKIVFNMIYDNKNSSANKISIIKITSLIYISYKAAELRKDINKLKRNLSKG